MNASDTDDTKCFRKVASRRKVVGVIRSLVNTSSLQLEYARVLHKGLLVPVLLYGRETMIWREKEESRIKGVKMDNLRGLLGVNRIDRVSNARFRELCGVAKGVDDKIEESVLHWFRNIETKKR